MLPAIILIVWCIGSSFSLSLSISSLITIGNTADLEWTLDLTDPRGFDLSLVSEDTSVSQGLSPIDSQGQNQGTHPILFNIGVFSEGIYHIEAFIAESLANTSSFHILSPGSNSVFVVQTSASAAPTQSTTQVVTPTKSLKIPGAIATDGIKPTFTTADSSPLSSSSLATSSHISKHASLITSPTTLVTSSWSLPGSSSAGPTETAVPGISKSPAPASKPHQSHLPLILGLSLAGTLTLFLILLILLRKRQRKIERLNATPYIFNSVIPARRLSKLVELAQQNDAADEDDASSEYFSVASVHVPEHNSPVALDSNIPHLMDFQAEAALLTEIIHLRREIASGEVHPMTYSGEESPGSHSRDTSLPSYPGSAV